MSELDAITQAAHEIARGRYTPDEAHPWMDDEFTAADYRKLAERSVHAATTLAEKQAEIHKLARDGYDDGDREVMADCLREILEALGCRGCDRDPSVRNENGQHTHDIPGCRL